MATSSQSQEPMLTLIERLFSEKSPSIAKDTKVFLHQKDKFYVYVKCIFTENKTLNVHEVYDLLDFRDNGDIYYRKVRFWIATLKGYTLKIFVLEIKSGELLTRTHRLNTDNDVCDWVLCSEHFFDNSDEKAIHDYCKCK